MGLLAAFAYFCKPGRGNDPSTASVPTLVLLCHSHTNSILFRLVAYFDDFRLLKPINLASAVGLWAVHHLRRSQVDGPYRPSITPWYNYIPLTFSWNYCFISYSVLSVFSTGVCPFGFRCLLYSTTILKGKKNVMQCTVM